MLDKAYVLYANDAYFDTVSACVRSIIEFARHPVIVYMVNSNKKVKGAYTIPWKSSAPDITHRDKYIDRKNPDIYKFLIERPMIVAHALRNQAKTVAYIDSDSVATEHINSIFDMYDDQLDYPYFVEGIYDYLHMDGKGGAETREDMSTTLEAPACDLFEVDQYVRQRYRQTGYFVAGQNTLPFLSEWYRMCNNYVVLSDPGYYAPYHEETIANVLLWKYKMLNGLPLIYVNASLFNINEIVTYPKWGEEIAPWVKLPNKKEELLFLHGEKDPEIMKQIMKKVNSPMRILYLAPHLSTGGMPSFLLKRIETVRDHLDVFVVEYENLSPDFVVHKNKIKALINPDQFFTLGENKMKLIDIIKKHNIDIVHIDENIESFGVPTDVINALYANDRTWRIVETCHNVWFNPDENKKMIPEAFAFCTFYHMTTFKNINTKKAVIEFPITKKIKSSYAAVELGFNLDRTNVINVGLWTPGKNQKEGIEIARKYQHMDFHFVGNQAGNFRDYWEPLMKDLPSNVKVWGERSDVDLFLQAADIFMFNSTWECNPLVLREAISYGLPIIARNLPQYGTIYNRFIQPIDTDLNTIKAGYAIPEQQNEFLEDIIELYVYMLATDIKVNTKILNNISIEQHYVDGPFLEVIGESDSDFTVGFYDEDNYEYYKTTLKVNHWSRPNKKWFTKWTAKVWENGALIYESVLDYKGKRVFISIESSSLGDTLAWIPYCLEFKKKHNCDVIVSTFLNRLLDYPELEFVEPGTVVPNIHGSYAIGWFYNMDKEPQVPASISLQKCATNILGLEYTEIKPRVISREVIEKPEKLVTIAIHSTAQAKYWNNPTGWQELVDWLKANGYTVKLVSREGEYYMGNNAPTGIEIHPSGDIDSVIDEIKKSCLFIGLGSGLSWLSWALGTPTAIISGFSYPWAEMTDCIRISTPEGKCTGCFNRTKLDAGNWNWCPDKREFECSRTITPAMVIDEIKKAGF